MRSTDLLVVGAGPFGLALAAQAGHQGVPHLVVGLPMSFWQQQMPAGMLLRSSASAVPAMLRAMPPKTMPWNGATAHQ